MPPNELYISIPSAELEECFCQILLRNQFSNERARECARIFTESSVDGVYSHGVNRFPRFIEYIQKGYIQPANSPILLNKMNGLEQWDGCLGPGVSNARFATQRATELASEFGIGCVALSNTNHWMRGGSYGWQAAKKGFLFVGFTNTIANMPAWGGIDKKLGNNPLVIALPFKDEAVVLDMAMSQYSYGAMEMAAMKHEELPTMGGYDKNGLLTSNPSAIMESGRLLPVGYWKGAGLSLLLDLLAAVLSGGLSTATISTREAEYGLSQVFIAIDLSGIQNNQTLHKIIEDILADYSASVAENEKTKIQYPGERVLQTRRKNLAHGVPVLKEVWEKIQKL